MRFGSYIKIADEGLENPGLRDAMHKSALSDLLKSVADSGMKRVGGVTIRMGYDSDDFIRSMTTIVMECKAYRAPRIVTKRSKKNLLRKPRKLIRYYKYHNWA